MKQISRFLTIAMIFLLSGAGVMQAQTAQEVLMPRWGKQVVEVSDELLFYDYMGHSAIQSSGSNNTLATIVFKPTVPGTVIQITFSEFDLRSDLNGSYQGHVKIYDGEVDPDNKFEYPSKPSDVVKSSTLPAGAVCDSIEGQYYSPKTYISKSPDGVMSVGCIFRYAKKSEGWVARVSAIKVSDMEVTGAGAVNTHVVQSPTGKKGVALAGAYVTATGILNPVNIKEVSFTLPQNEQVVDPSKLQLYEGELSEFKDATPIATTFKQSGGTYTFTLQHALSEGRNVFTVAGDILPTAKFGSKVQASVTGVKTSTAPDGVAGFVPSTPVVVTIPHMVLMPSGESSFVVGDTPILFFDDGGKDGKISENFNGTIVFKPETPGKKVMVDFTKVTLFESSNKNEILNVYNGSEATPSNLVCRILSGKPERVRSTAADGSITVSLVCDTGFPKDGFEATVSQFAPQPMRVENITAAQPETATVCAGDVAQPILSFNIRTVDTEPVLTASRFTFTTNSTSEQVVKASLYRTGRSSEFSSKEKVGEVDVTADGFVVATTAPVSLAEGDNYFWLAYDIAVNVVNGARVDASIQSVTLSDGDRNVANGNPAGERIVENTVTSKVGSVEKTVYGTWKFVSEKNPLSYYDGYNPVEGDQITTFVPGTKGMKIELDIKTFAVYYASNSWGTKAKFEVYSGKDASGELLWSLTDAADKDKGPGRILRSKSPDGALTVIFDAKTTSSSYTAKGWTAEVREYLSKPMEAVSVSALQVGDGAVKPGVKNQEIIGFNLVTAGDLDPVNFAEVAIDLKGSQKSVENVYLYYTGASSTIVKENAVVSMAISATAKDTVVIAPSAPMKLIEGDNYFWISYDISDGAPVDSHIDAAVVSVKAGSKTVVPAEGQGDPDGFCIVKNLFIMQHGSNGEIEIGNNSLMFYDNGGPDGKTPKDFEGVVTFAPRDPGKVIKMSFRKWKPNGNYDKMLIYFGGDVASKEDVKLQSQNTLPADVVSTSADGKMTVKFTSPSYSYQSDGWEIEVSQYELQELAVANVSSVAVVPEKLMRGMTDVAMLDVAVTVTGDKGELELTSMGVSSEDTKDGLLSGISIFATGKTAVYSPVDNIMHCEAAPYELTGSYKITSAGTYHFWVACDVAASAALHERIKVSMGKITVSAKEYQPETTVVAETTVKKGISGTFAVGEGCEYATIQSAIDALKGGIDGPVVINVRNGKYEEEVTVPEIPGASSVNTITLQSESGKREDVTIFSNYYEEPAYSDDKMSQEYGVVTFDGVDYFTLKGVTVTTEDINYPSVIHYRNQSRHVTVDDCHIYTVRSESTQTSQDIRLVYQYAKNEENQNNDFPTVRNCLIDGGYMGVVIQGTSFVRLPKQRGAVIENNIFRNQGSKAIYSSSHERDMTIRGNVIENRTTAKSGFIAMDLETSENLIIEGNSIYLQTGADATAINIRGIAGTSEKPGRIFNNEVAVKCADSTSAGIKLSSASTNVDIANNTVLMTSGQATKSALGVALWINNTTTAVTVRNNVFMEEEGGFVYRFYRDNCYECVEFSNNMLYTSGSHFVKSNPTEFKTFAEWTAASGEKNSFNEHVSFHSASILFPAAAGNLRNAMPLSFVATDKDGNQRDAASPTIGAYEYSESVQAPAYVSGYPSFSGITNVSAVATLQADANATAYTMLRSSSEAVPTVEELKASEQVMELRKNKSVAISLEGLSRQSEYRLYSLLVSINGRGVSQVLSSDVFSTTFDPTKVSTFEETTPTDIGFVAGTAAFSGFTIETATDAVVNGIKVAKVGEGASITLTNTDRGLVLTGFFLKSDADLTLAVYDGDGVKKDHIVASTQNAWVFVNLKDKGVVARLDMAVSGNAYIDNFSGDPLELAASAVLAEISAEEGNRASLGVNVDGGVYPYTYEWKDAKLLPVSAERECETPVLKHSEAYTVTVTDAWGKVASARVLVYVKGGVYEATFDDNYLESESHYNGLGEEIGDWTHPGIDSKFFSGSFAFNTNRHTATWWGGFGMSSETSTSFGSLADQFRSAAGGGHNSANYGVAYAAEAGGVQSIDVSNAPSGAVVSGFYVTNAAYTADAIVNGDGMSNRGGGFEKGDYFKLIVKGEKADGSVATLDYYLADYRSANDADHYWLDSWQWVDLRSLGEVKKFTFAFDGTKRNNYGLTTPTYFCLDDFGGKRVVADASRQVVGTSSAYRIALDTVFTVENNGSSVEYCITDSCDKSVAVAELGKEGILKITGLKDFHSTELIVSACQQGKLQFVRIPVDVDQNKFSSVNASGFADVMVYPVPARENLNIRTAMNNYIIEITSSSGTCVYRKGGNCGSVTLPISHLAAGVYVLTLRDENSAVNKMFVVE